jgi:hypothetical protein
MEIYKTIKNIAAITLISTMPYICNSCGYKDKEAVAKTATTKKTSCNLESIITKNID